MRDRNELVKRIYEISAELGIEPVLPMEISLRVRDASGLEILNRSEPAHSWTRNAWNYLFAFFGDAGAVGSSFGAGFMTGKRIDGTIDYSTGYCCCQGYVAEVDASTFVNEQENGNYGIVAGTSSTAFDPDQYALGAIIPHGSGEGQLYYMAMLQSVRSYNETSKVWQARFSRTIHNYHTADMTVREIGLYCSCELFGSVHFYLMARDVLETPAVIPYGGDLVVNYDVKVPFGAIDG